MIQRTEQTSIGSIECKICDAAVPVGIKPMRWELDDDGTKYLVLEPDLTDAFAHLWTHTHG